MATFETTIIVPRTLDETFAFVSDFRNAAVWDPRTYSAQMVPDGAVGLGTRFTLTGGVLSKGLIDRLKIPESVAGMPLPYDVVVFDPPHQLVLEGETSVFRYRDHLSFAAIEGGPCTELRYSAELRFKGLLAIGEPFLRLMFKRIGDDATRGIPRTVS